MSQFKSTSYHIQIKHVAMESNQYSLSSLQNLKRKSSASQAIKPFKLSYSWKEHMANVRIIRFITEVSPPQFLTLWDLEHQICWIQPMRRIEFLHIPCCRHHLTMLQLHLLTPNTAEAQDLLSSLYHELYISWLTYRGLKGTCILIISII